MIPNQWYVVLSSDEVRERPVAARRMGERLVFWRDASGRLACVRDTCVHRGVALSRGRVIGGQLECPFHGFTYDPTGRVTSIPANGRAAPVPAVFRVRAYPTHEAHGFVWLWWGDAAGTEPPPPRFFDDLDGPFGHATVADPWATHYSRVIENQLDMAHLPFVHATTIGRGGRTVVDGPGVKWIDDDCFHVYVFNRRDDGTPARKPDEVPLEPEPAFKLEFIFPNLWQNHISKQVRIVAAFVPVDDAHTLLYLRFYQRNITVPWLRDLAARLAMPGNLYIAHQDRRVVETHAVGPSALHGGEQLIRADHAIIEYRRRRDALLAAARTD